MRSNRESAGTSQSSATEDVRLFKILNEDDAVIFAETNALTQSLPQEIFYFSLDALHAHFAASGTTTPDVLQHIVVSALAPLD